MIELQVALGARSYPIFVGRQILDSKGLITDYLTGRQVCIVTNEVVAPLHLKKILAALPPDVHADVLSIADGEQYKTLATYEKVLNFLLAKKHGRNTTLIALGGGVVGDITGFVAATFQRGVNFIQVPTTLLAQVDSSVGGKTAVNHPSGKNMIGAFYQPGCVVADLSLLDTLKVEEYVAGLAEVVKYGMIANSEFFTWLEVNAEALLQRDTQALSHAVAQSCEIKAQVVAEDEREANRRVILNFGHTFGHAYESLCGYGTLRHGEAVAMGMVAAADYAVRCSYLHKKDFQRLRNLLVALGLPVVAPELAASDVRQVMAGDKKVIDSHLRLVIPDGIGHAIVIDDIDETQLNHTLELGH